MARKQQALYFGVLAMMTGVVIIALGGGLFGQETFWKAQWQHRAFLTLCHQIPGRSFWIYGQPMAVCSRCFGIYTGFLAGWIVLPLIAFSNFSIPISPRIILLGIILLNFIDVFGNLLGFWQNTLLSRWVLGWLAGTAAALLFSGSFFIRINKSEEIYYGRVTTPGF